MSIKSTINSPTKIKSKRKSSTKKSKRKSSTKKSKRKSSTKKSKRKSSTKKSKSKKSSTKKSKSKKSSTKKSSTKKSKSKSTNKKNIKPVIILQKSKIASKKLAVIIGNKTINFGGKGYSDFTIHKDVERMHLYEGRHRSRENWTKSGLKTAGFWSKWILWNKPSLAGSIKDTSKRFNINILNRIK